MVDTQDLWMYVYLWIWTVDAAYSGGINVVVESQSVLLSRNRNTKLLE